MNPRGYWGTAIQFASIVGPLFTIVTWLVDGGYLSDYIPGGIFVGILSGTIMGFLFKSDRISLPVEGNENALGKMQMTLAEIGYFPKSNLGNVFQFGPSFQAGLLSGRISVQQNSDSFEVVGPKWFLKKILKRWR